MARDPARTVRERSIVAIFGSVRFPDMVSEMQAR